MSPVWKTPDCAIPVELFWMLFNELGRVLALEQLAFARAVRLGIRLEQEDPDAEMEAEFLHDQALPIAAPAPRKTDVIFPFST